MVRRAALHAALGDPGRLTIVDTLAWGEASPGELAARLGMTSNLLAHHLRVLEDAGLLTRHRSEGDRRRSYVALNRDVLDLLQPSSPALVAERVVFVCTHNSARSQLAAAMWNDHSPVPATSAGTHPAPRVHPGAVAVAHRRHLSLVPAPPRHVQRRPRPRRPGRDRLRQRPRRTRHRELLPRAGRSGGRGCTGRSPTR